MNRILTQALRNSHGSTGFEILISEWGTMEEWGRSETGRRPRPKIEDLLTLFRQINNYRAASYVNHEILGGNILSYFTYFMQIYIYLKWDAMMIT